MPSETLQKGISLQGKELLQTGILSPKTAAFLRVLAGRLKDSPRSVVNTTGLTDMGVEHYTMLFQKKLGPILERVRQDPTIQQRFQEWWNTLPTGDTEGTTFIKIDEKGIEEILKFFNANGSELVRGELQFLITRVFV